MSKGKVGPTKHLIPLHTSSVLGAIAAWFLFDLDDKDPPSTSRLYLVLGCVALAQLIGLIATTYLIRESKSTKPVKGKRTSIDNVVTKSPSESRLISLRNDVLCISFSIITFHVLIILLGADVIGHTERTFALSCLLTLFTMANLVAIKPSRYPYVKISSSSSHPLNSSSSNIDQEQENPSILDRILLSTPLQISDEVENFLITNCYIVLAGSWFGAFPIKLDWNEPWQEFPVTCMVGAGVANALSHIVHLGLVGVKCVLS